MSAEPRVRQEVDVEKTDRGEPGDLTGEGGLGPEGGSEAPGLRRREFLTHLASAGVVLAVGSVGAYGFMKVTTSAVSSPHPETARRWGFVIDLDLCDGCVDKEVPACVSACRLAHFLPEGQDWITVREQEDAWGFPYFQPTLCMNCQKAPCEDVCPVHATFYNDDDIVLIDHRLCIGCRYCIPACPYGVRSFNWTQPDNSAIPADKEYSPDAPWPHVKGTAAKCDFCAHKLAHGDLPHCTACPNGAIAFGDLAEDAVTTAKGETFQVSTVFRERSAYRLKAEKGTQPRVYYLPPR